MNEPARQGTDFDSRKVGNQTKGRSRDRKTEAQDGNLISPDKEENQVLTFDSSIKINQKVPIRVLQDNFEEVNDFCLSKKISKKGPDYSSKKRNRSENACSK
jgi:hypothetical protein